MSVFIQLTPEMESNVIKYSDPHLLLDGEKSINWAIIVSKYRLNDTEVKSRDPAPRPIFSSHQRMLKTIS